VRILATLVALALAATLGGPAVAASLGTGQPATTAKAKKKKHKPRCTKRKHHSKKIKRCMAKKKAEKKKAPVKKPTPPAATTPAPPATNQPPAEQLGSYVSAQSKEFSITLSRPAVAAGQVTVEFRNAGEDPHNLDLAPEATHDPFGSFDDLAPAAISTKKFSFAPGRYTLYCSLPGHEGLGMKATLTVK
jgi:plastocyanin